MTMNLYSPTICTVITKSYLAHARALATSFLNVHPEGTCYVLLADRRDGYFDPANEPFILIESEELPQYSFINAMAFYYTPFELCNALKPFLHDFLIQRTCLDRWIYLDADILVRNSLDSLFEQLNGTSILLNRHVATPSDSENAHPVETTVLKYGLFNGGVLGLRRSTMTREFVNWFSDRLRRFAFADGRYFVDQLWLNLVPTFFSETKVCDDPGVNLGFWNLHSRRLTKDASGMIRCNGEPLAFVHYAGWDIERPEVVTRYSPLYNDVIIPVWAELGNTYRNLLLDNGYRTVKHWPYTFDYFDNGEPITLEMRRYYYSLIENGLAPEGSPFSQHELLCSACQPCRPMRWSRLIFKPVRQSLRRLRGGATRIG